MTYPVKIRVRIDYTKINQRWIQVLKVEKKKKKNNYKRENKEHLKESWGRI